MRAQCICAGAWHATHPKHQHAHAAHRGHGKQHVSWHLWWGLRLEKVVDDAAEVEMAGNGWICSLRGQQASAGLQDHQRQRHIPPRLIPNPQHGCTHPVNWLLSWSGGSCPSGSGGLVAGSPRTFSSACTEKVSCAGVSGRTARHSRPASRLPSGAGLAGRPKAHAGSCVRPGVRPVLCSPLRSPGLAPRCARWAAASKPLPPSWLTPASSSPSSPSLPCSSCEPPPAGS